MIRKQTWSVVVTAVLVPVAVVLVCLGCLGLGPLWAIGATGIEPESVGLLGQGGDPRVVVIGFPWDEEGFCTGTFRVDVSETATEVRVGTVRAERWHIGACAGLGTVDGHAAVEARLAAPLGDRRAIRASDGAQLAIYRPTT